MSSTSALESNEDLENVPLVRMEDVQPDRSEMYIKKDSLETYEYNDVDDSNIGCMISVQSEEVVGPDESDDAEVIVPDLPISKPLTLNVEPKRELEDKPNPESWPTLEILPGGVIKYAKKHNDFLSRFYQNENESNQSADENDEHLMYACAKCSQRFKFLFCLVRHVKSHEEKNKVEAPDLCNKKKNVICLHTSKRKATSKLKTKCRTPKKS